LNLQWLYGAASAPVPDIGEPMKPCRLILIVSLALLAAGCASTKQLAERDNERCAARGFQPNTDAFSNCLVQLDSERDARKDANRRALLEKPDIPYIPPMNR
jgi:hypothetical protein